MAWAYLEIIPAAAGLADPVDERVVEAYWLGNDLLERVDPALFARAARTKFAREIGAHWAALAPRGAPGRPGEGPPSWISGLHCRPCWDAATPR